MTKSANPGATGIGPAHPAFAAHFARSIYHPDHPEFGADVPPFGSDEGWDEVLEWGSRVEELTDHPRLRYMIEQGDPDAEALVSEMAETEQVDADDILIGLLEQAITRQRDRFGETISEYDVLLTDLGSFDNPLLPAAARAKPRLWRKIFPELAGSNVE